MGIPAIPEKENSDATFREDIMSQNIGEKEQALRDAREKRAVAIRPTRETLAAKLPKTSGKKPVKRKKTLVSSAK